MARVTDVDADRAPNPPEFLAPVLQQHAQARERIV
jgi:hypothetical protein